MPADRFGDYLTAGAGNIPARWRRLVRTVLALAFGSVVSGGNLVAQVLTCNTSGNDRCTVVHYHVQRWDRATKNYVEFFGVSRFATIDTCEAAKAKDSAAYETHFKELRKLDPRFKMEPNRYGPCHCDMTENTGDPHFLDDARRELQVRRLRELDLDLLDEYLKRGITLDGEIARSLISTPTSQLRSSAWPLEVTIPREAADRSIDGSKNALRPTSVTVTKGSGQPGASLDPAEVRYDPTLATTAVDPSVIVVDVSSTETFVDIEIKRVTELLEVAMQGDGDEALLDAANQRIQLLTNLGRVGEVGGARSELSQMLHSATSDSQRIELVQMLFGSRIASTWNATGAAEMHVELPPEVATDPTGVLRDTSDRYGREHRQLAIFALLTRNATLTESQEVWLSGVIDQMLGRGSQ